MTRIRQGQRRQPVISIVTPLYNKAGSISRAITSVLDQEWSDFEHIIVDDGSEDGSAERVKAFSDQRLRLVSQENQGAAAARNRGIALSSGTHVAFLDADDAWLPGFLTAIVDLIQRFPRAGAYATGYFIKDPYHPLRAARFECVPSAPEGGLIDSYFRVVSRGANPVWASAVCIPRSTLDRVGGFPDGLRLLEDLHLWARIALHYRIAYQPRPLAIYYRDAENRRGPVARSAADLKFSCAVRTAIETSQLSHAEAIHAQSFINHYHLLSAFKTLIAGHHKVALQIAQELRPGHCNEAAKKYLILLLARLPHPLVLLAWRAGKTIKRVMSRRRLTHESAQ